MSSTRIKICGIKSVETAQIAMNAGAEVIGLVVEVPHSPRCLTADEAHAIVRGLPAQVMAVCVVQNPDPALAKHLPGTWVQLHGDEEDALVAEFAQTKHVIKGFRFDPDTVRRWSDHRHVDMLLIDGPAGGTGESFDHRQLREMMPSIEKPVILAGGLTAANVAAAIQLVRPFCVDVSSGVESSPGVKDAELIQEFCAAVQQADAQD